MRCVVTLKDGGAMERAMGALARYRYTANGEPVAPDTQGSGKSGFLRSIRQRLRQSATMSMMGVSSTSSPSMSQRAPASTESTARYAKIVAS
jgi:hypothetical protein